MGGKTGICAVTGARRQLTKGVAGQVEEDHGLKVVQIHFIVVHERAIRAVVGFQGLAFQHGMAGCTVILGEDQQSWLVAAVTALPTIGAAAFRF